jgi:hypothetical protein
MPRCRSAALPRIEIGVSGDTQNLQMLKLKLIENNWGKVLFRI